MSEGDLPGWVHNVGRVIPVSQSVSAVFGVAALVLGVLNLENCPVQPLIPNRCVCMFFLLSLVILVHPKIAEALLRYLIFHGLISIAAALISLYVAWKRADTRPYEAPKGLLAVNAVLFIVGLVVFVLGMIWTFGASPTYDDQSKPTYCHYWTYFFAYASLVIAIFVLIGSSCFICGLGCHVVKQSKTAYRAGERVEE